MKIQIEFIKVRITEFSNGKFKRYLLCSGSDYKVLRNPYKAITYSHPTTYTQFPTNLPMFRKYVFHFPHSSLDRKSNIKRPLEYDYHEFIRSLRAKGEIVAVVHYETEWTPFLMFCSVGSTVVHLVTCGCHKVYWSSYISRCPGAYWLLGSVKMVAFSEQLMAFYIYRESSAQRPDVSNALIYNVAPE